MRLLKAESDGSLRLLELFGDSIPQYAILSHTWEPDGDEVTFRDLQRSSEIYKSKPEHAKSSFVPDKLHVTIWNSSGLIPPASTNLVAQSFRKRSIPCSVGIRTRPSAMCTLRTFHQLQRTVWKRFERADGSRVVGHCKSFLLLEMYKSSLKKGFIWVARTSLCNSSTM